MKKILLSGIKPTGRPHIGNYFGAMKQFVELQNDFQCFIFVANLHALTTLHDKSAVNEYTKGVVLDYLAIGLDPKKVTLFKQSDISAHSELAWIFSCITTMPYLMRAHAFKDAQAKNKEITVGVFEYPLLMAADILLYGPDIVPVGLDQKQHVEIARDTAEKFNKLFGETFKLPEPLIKEDVQTVPGIDGRKMSKSYGNTIELFATDDELKKSVMSIVTDSKGVNESKDPSKCNVFALHKLFSSPAELEELSDRYTQGKIGYKESKELLFEKISKFIRPMRERRSELEKESSLISSILEEGRRVASEVADNMLARVKMATGLNS